MIFNELIFKEFIILFCREFFNIRIKKKHRKHSKTADVT